MQYSSEVISEQRSSVVNKRKTKTNTISILTVLWPQTQPSSSLNIVQTNSKEET